MLFSFDARETQFIVDSRSASSHSRKFCSGVKRKAGLGFSFCIINVNRNYSSHSPCAEIFSDK